MCTPSRQSSCLRCMQLWDGRAVVLGVPAAFFISFPLGLPPHPTTLLPQVLHVESPWEEKRRREREAAEAAAAAAGDAALLQLRGGQSGLGALSLGRSLGERAAEGSGSAGGAGMGAGSPRLPAAQGGGASHAAGSGGGDTAVLQTPVARQTEAGQFLLNRCVGYCRAAACTGVVVGWSVVWWLLCGGVRFKNVRRQACYDHTRITPTSAGGWQLSMEGGSVSVTHVARIHAEPPQLYSAPLAGRGAGTCPAALTHAKPPQPCPAPLAGRGTGTCWSGCSS